MDGWMECCFSTVFLSYTADKRVIIRAILNCKSNLWLKVKVVKKLKS